MGEGRARGRRSILRFPMQPVLAASLLACRWIAVLNRDCAAGRLCPVKRVPCLAGRVALLALAVLCGCRDFTNDAARLVIVSVVSAAA